MPKSLATVDIASHKAVAPTIYNCLDDEIEPYKPMLGRWLLQMALMLRWTKPSGQGRDNMPDIFEDEDLIALTGIDAEFASDFEDGETTRFRSRRRCYREEADGASLVESRLAELKEARLSPDLPLFVNSDLLGRLIGATDADKAVLLFAAALSQFPAFRHAVSARCVRFSNQSLSKLISALTGQSETEINLSLSVNSPLVSSGIVKVSAGVCDIEEKLSLIETLGELLLAQDLSERRIAERFIKPAGFSELSASSFAHLRRDIEKACPAHCRPRSVCHLLGSATARFRYTNPSHRTVPVAESGSRYHAACL